MNYGKLTKMNLIQFMHMFENNSQANNGHLYFFGTFSMSVPHYIVLHCIPLHINIKHFVC